MDHNVGRAAQSLEGHGGSVLYYPLALLVGFFPWSVFAIPTALEIVHRLRSQATDRTAHVLALSWLGVYVGLFSIAQTKLPSYITPSYPAVALLVANFIAAWSAGTSHVASMWPRAAFACLGIVGLIVVVAIPVAATRYLPGEQWLGGLGLVPLLSAGVGLVLIRRDARTQAAVVFAAGAVAFATGTFAIGAARVDSHQKFDTFVQVLRQRSPHPQIGTLGVAEPSWVFYTGRPLDRLFVPETLSDMPRERVMLGPPPKGDWQPKPSWNVWHYLSQSPDHYAITSEQYVKSIGGLRGDVEVLARTPYFLQHDTLLLLAARTTVAQAPGGRLQAPGPRLQAGGETR